MSSNTLDPPKNPNFAATVIRVQSVVPLDGCDNIQGLPMFGYQAIVDKTTQPGDVGVIFPAEVQLSEDFVRENNLYRHNTYNANPEKTGYLEDNRRVRAIRLRGHRSDALFMPLESLDYLGDQLGGLLPSETLLVGDEFDTLSGHEVCRKYLRPHQGGPGIRSINPRIKFERVDGRMFPEHFDTTNFFKTNLPPETSVVITQKLHGTSVRVGHVPVARKLKIRERIARRLGVRVQEVEHDYVFGSHHVVKDANNPHQQHYYSEDIWTAEGRKLAGLLPANFIVYGELVGWTSENGPIQKGYTYDQAPGTAKLYVYRVAYVSPTGELTDLSWPQIKEFCALKGLTPVREMYAGPLGGIDINALLDQDFRKLGYDTVPIADTSKCDEGVCIRVEGLRPTIVKAKSPLFLNHETRMLDKGEADMEEAA